MRVSIKAAVVAGIVALANAGERASAEVLTVPTVTENTLATLVPDVTYTDIPNGFARSQLRMDIIKPVSARPTPAIVFVSGNGWRSIDKSSLIPQLAPFAKSGYLVASVEYRVIGEAVFPEPLKDVKSAIRFLRANAARFNIDPTRIAVWGNSAGGQLAGMVGVTGDRPEFENDKWAGQSDAVQAVVAWYGAFDLATTTGESPTSYRYVESAHVGYDVHDPANRDRLSRTNPTTYVSATSPPFLLVHGTDDKQVPVHQSEVLHDALRDAKVDATLIKVEGAGHSFGQVSSNPRVMSAMQAFLNRVLKPQP